MTTTCVTLMQALTLSEAFMQPISLGCERCSFAGSIRRRESMIENLDVVVIRTRGDGVPGADELDRILAQMLANGDLQPGRANGDKYKQFVLPDSGLRVNLYLVRPETWGVQLAIRTGPREYSKAIVTPWRFGGLLRDGLQVADGRVWQPTDELARSTDDLRRGKWAAVPTPEESDFLAMCVRGGYRTQSTRNAAGRAAARRVAEFDWRRTRCHQKPSR